MDEHAPTDPSDPSDPTDPTAPSLPTDPAGPSDPVSPDFDAAGDPLPASSFAPGLDDEALGFSAAVRRPAGCPWCGGALPEPDLASCPTCGAALHPVAELPDIPGVTVAPADVRRTVRDVSPEIRALVTPPVTDAIALPGARPELGPPDPSVRRAMLQFELEARRAALANAALSAPEGSDADAADVADVADAAIAADGAGSEAGPEA